MTTRWPARFVALMAAIFAILLATMPDADAARRMKRPTYQQLKSKFVPMVFFVAKGDPNACGPGCDTWISAEGDFDEGAAQRFREFLARLGNRDLPVIFHSRGGLVGQAVSIGDSIYAKRLTASLGRTSTTECRRLSKSACDALKSSAKELRSRLQTNALCASACVYAVVGGITRKIPANASVQVHAPRDFGNLAEAQRSQFYALVNGYLARAGVKPELMKLTMSTPNERIRTLTRKEIVQFGIEWSEPVALWETNYDTRPRVSGPSNLHQARVRFSRPAWSGNGVIDIELRLRCSNSTVLVIYNGYGKQDGDAAASDVVLLLDSRPVRLEWSHNSGPQLEVRSASISGELARALRTAQNIAITRIPNLQWKSEIGRSGFDDAMREVTKVCPKAFVDPEAAIHLDKGKAINPVRPAFEQSFPHANFRPPDQA